MNAPTIDDFKEWLLEQSKDVESRYMRWLYKDDGEQDTERDFCPECAEIQAEVERRYCVDGFTNVDGWNEFYQSDGARFCERCGVLLDVALTEWGIDYDYLYAFESGEIAGGPLPVDCYVIHQFLDGVGEFSEEKHWPRLQKLAADWMT